MATLPNLINTDLSRGFTVSQVAEKHNWTEPMVWSFALEDKEDLERFKGLGWGLRTWDQWEWNDCDKRFGDDWPGRIPAQLIAHILGRVAEEVNRLVNRIIEDINSFVRTQPQVSEGSKEVAIAV